jgi:hypothetical protein
LTTTGGLSGLSTFVSDVSSPSATPCVIIKNLIIVYNDSLAGESWFD